jgi:hypothetical protein
MNIIIIVGNNIGKLLLEHNADIHVDHNYVLQITSGNNHLK